MGRLRVLPYASYSQSAKQLAHELGGKRIRLSDSRYVAKPDDLVINWGHSGPYPFEISSPLVKVWNQNTFISNITNKLLFFQSNRGADWLPPFWTDAEEIPDDETFPIICRTVLNGHSGQGIVVANDCSDLVPCDLYVKYIKKKDEYRIHIGTYDYDEYFPISIQQKKRRLEHENPDWQIRNHANGFIYARQNVDPPSGVLQCAVDCLRGSGLDFGAVDVIWNEQLQRAYVLEVNTAPGLEGTTLDDYVNFFKEAMTDA